MNSLAVLLLASSALAFELPVAMHVQRPVPWEHHVEIDADGTLRLDGTTAQQPPAMVELHLAADTDARWGRVWEVLYQAAPRDDVLRVHAQTVDGVGAEGELPLTVVDMPPSPAPPPPPPGATVADAPPAGALTPRQQATLALLGGSSDSTGYHDALFVAVYLDGGLALNSRAFATGEALEAAVGQRLRVLTSNNVILEAHPGVDWGRVVAVADGMCGLGARVLLVETEPEGPRPPRL